MPTDETPAEPRRQRADDQEMFVVQIGDKRIKGAGPATIGVLMTFMVLAGLAGLYHEINNKLESVVEALDRSSWLCLLTPEQRLKIQADMPPSVREMILRGEFPRRFPDRSR